MTQGNIASSASVPTRSLQPSLKVFCAVLKIGTLSAELIVIALLIDGHVTLSLALVMHLALFGMLLALVLVTEQAGHRAGNLQVFALQMLVAGPLGAASALTGEQLAARTRSDRLTAWYETLAPAPQTVVTLADRIIDDQVVRPRARLPKSVDQLILSGSMREKQALFASIASDGRIEGVNLIEKALRSRDQRVRVQAAAVSAFIRSKLRKSAGAPYSNRPVADNDHDAPIATEAN